jgi:hypothetical protein
MGQGVSSRRDYRERVIFKVAATSIAVVHLLFVVFVIAGGLLVLRWRKLAFLHVPAAVWGVMIELAGWYCPLTRYENYFLRRAGEAGYADGFLAHHIFAVIYPNGLTRGIEISLGAFVLAVNLAVYVKILR